MSTWLSLEITLPDEATEDTVEALTTALFEAGCAGVEAQNTPELKRAAIAEKLAPPEGPIKVIASFSGETDADALLETIHGVLGEVGIEDAQVAIRTEAPVDWATHWRRHFHPLQFGPLWVVPTWLEAPADAKAVLRMDPGMAFGTGSHETTAMCLERIVELSPMPSVLDVGTGTGILALGALLLGAERAVGTDNDPDALKVARENAELNGLGDRLELSGNTPERLGQRFPVVVANILAEPLIKLAPQLARAVAPGGALSLSGVLLTQAEQVAKAYEAQGLKRLKIAERGEWSRIDLEAPAES